MGETGSPPGDIDVLIVGTTPQSALAEIAHTAEHELRREVNIARVSPSDWQASATAFVKTVKSRPLMSLRRGTVSA